MTRRRTTMEERITPCECCKHPISHRHHLLSAAQFGETELTVQLCPNCHELVHWCYRERTQRRWKDRGAWTQFIVMIPSGDNRIKYIQWLVGWMMDLETATNDDSIDRVVELAQRFETDRRERGGRP